MLGTAVPLLALATCATIRLLTSLDIFWLDELWTWRLAQPITAPHEVLTSIRRANKHDLNTWIVYALGPHTHWLPPTPSGSRRLLRTLAVDSVWKCPTAGPTEVDAAAR